MKNNMVVWFEIPVSDMDRAKAFYEEVFQVDINVVNFGGLLMGWFPDRGQEIIESGLEQAAQAAKIF